MTAKPFDLIVYGATGFTGQKVAQEIALHGPKIKWAIAGRDLTKLEKLYAALDCQGNRPVLCVADVKDQEALNDCIAKAKVCISCVGPFRLYGEPVIQACLAGQTHYVDICGETEYIEKLYAEYNNKALIEQLTLVPACGYDSIPADIGCLHNKLQFKKWNGTPSSVEMFVKFNSGPSGIGVNATTFISAVLGFSSVDQLRALRKRTHRRVSTVGMKQLVRRGTVWDQRMQAWTLPAAVADVPVVKLGQQMVENHKEAFEQGDKMKAYVPLDVQPVQFAGYFCLTSWISVLYMWYIGFLLTMAAKSKRLQNWLIDYPDWFTLGVFKKNGPSQQQLKESSFEQTFVGLGYQAGESTQGSPSLEITTQIQGPECGYVTTPICVVTAALMLLDKEQDKIPFGVLTPAAAFNGVAEEFIDRLQDSINQFSITPI